MTGIECRGWIQVLTESFPRSRSRKLKKTLAVMGDDLGGHWEVGLLGTKNIFSVGLRYFGSDSNLNFNRFRKEVVSFVKEPGSDRFLPPPAGFPWMSFWWNLKTDSLEDASLYRRGTRLKSTQTLAYESTGTLKLFNTKPLSVDYFQNTELEEFFSNVAGLFPVRDIVSEWEMRGGKRFKAGERWSLRFQQAVPWPRFICSNIADPFLSNSARLAFLLLNWKVSEISFEGGTVRVYLRS